MTALTLTADMRIMVGHELEYRAKRGERVVIVPRVPQSMFVDVHEQWSDKNHGQTLAGIRSRGGFDAIEMLAVFACAPWEAVKDIPEETAHRLLYAMIATHNRGMRIAEAAARSALTIL
jgi:hypothetical protein